MSDAKLPSKFQIRASNEVREAMSSQSGQKFDFVNIARSVKIVAQRAMRELFGVASSAKTVSFQRDRSDLSHKKNEKAAPRT
jgi:hypothetical protein